VKFQSTYCTTTYEGYKQLSVLEKGKGHNGFGADAEYKNIIQRSSTTKREYRRYDISNPILEIVSPLFRRVVATR
jgi:hypothetical protein